jgi:hypothetical protein
MMRTATVVLLLVCVFGLCWLGASRLVLRRRLLRDDAVFRCLVRVDRGYLRGLPTHSRGAPCLARWSHDVLLLHQGIWLLRIHALPVHTTLDTLEVAAPADRLRRRQEAVALVLCLDDGARVRVTAATQSQERLAGPFLALAVRRAPTQAPGTEVPGQRSE